jgi:lipopolysaccharide/colanic/teichoic acid biosynthesis glycosyltransferase
MAGIGIVLSSPLWALIAIAIKLDDRGPVFYRQSRWGRGGRPFTLFKFRSMVSDSDERYGITGALKKDHRVTRVGRLLRATGMDELPQFLNILFGHMSFVGPRALAIGEVLSDEHGNEIDYLAVPNFRRRWAVQPGLTGPATIYLPKDASPSSKLTYDLKYIEDWSFWGDVKLILMSFWISFRGKWETRDKKY